MNKHFFCNLQSILSVCLTLLLSSCSTMDNALSKVKNVDLWPFDDGSNSEQVRTYHPANSIEYRCEKGKKFFIRYLDKGDKVWLMTKEREIALGKTGQSEYATEGIKLSLLKDNTQLTMPADTAYSNCQIVPLK